MSYIQESLGAGEIIVARAKFHWLFIAGAVAALAVPFILLLACLVWCKSQTVPFDRANLSTWACLPAGLFFLWGVGTFLKRMNQLLSTEIGITSHRFVEKYGLLSMRTNEIALPNIEGVRVHQTVLGRMFGYGTVRIEGTGVDAVNTPTIADPVGFVRAIQTAREHQPGKV
jgi:uncharacterized membrane protein YdbT with pleckstrin-like domain